jgi:hypothetical protein
MPAPSTPSTDTTAPDTTASGTAAPANRAERRAKRDQPVPPTARYRGSAARPRPAQGRRVNPVRRSG